MVNVDKVYKTVLYILNKEQRGYLTPAEFSKVASQVQLEIFEQYFEDMNQQLRVPENDSEYANRVKNLEEKMAIFETDGVITYVGPNYTFPANTHRIGTIAYSGKELQRVSHKDYLLINKSPLTCPTESYPLYILEGTGAPSAAPTVATVKPDSIQSDLPLYYIRRPEDPIWAYIIGSQGQYVYQEAADPAAYPTTGSVQFELHSSEQTNIILQILMYSGIIIRDPQVVQTAAAMVQQQEVNEKS